MSIEPILASTPFIRWHLALALLAFPLGLSQLLLKKGTARHKILGYIFVLFVAMLCFVSFFIKSLFPSLGLEKIFFGFSPLHLLSIYVLYSLCKSIIAIKNGDIVTHQKTMAGIFYGGLLLAGFFTLMPGRLLFNVLFGG